MNWTQTGRGVWKSEEGYIIRAHPSALSPEGWTYCAWAPPLSDREYQDKLKERYGPLELLPMRIPLIGYFTKPEDARAACVRHVKVGT